MAKRGRRATARAPTGARRRLQRNRVCLKFGRRLCVFSMCTSWLQQCSWQQQQQQRQRQWHQQCGSRLGKVACLRICVATNSYTTTLLLYYTTSLLLLLLDTTNTITYSTTSTTTTTTTTTTTLTGNRTNYSYYSNKFITRKGGNEGWRPLDDAKEDSGQSSMARADAHYP